MLLFKGYVRFRKSCYAAASENHGLQGDGPDTEHEMFTDLAVLILQQNAVQLFREVCLRSHLNKFIHLSMWRSNSELFLGD